MSVAVNSILDLIEARFELISESNEYNTTVKKIERAKLTPFKSHDLPALNYWPVNVGNERQYGTDSRFFKLMVEYHSKTRERPFSDVAGELAADVVTAINRSTSDPKVSDDQSLDLGGLVSDVVFDGYDYEIGEGQAPWCGVLVQFTIKYSTSINDMESFSA